MPSSYTSRLRLEKPGSGEQAGTWGITANTDYDLIDQGVAGVITITHDNTANYTLTALSGASDEARNLTLVITGTLTAARNIIIPSTQKVYLVRNATTGGYAITVKTSAGSGVQISNGFNQWVYSDGTNVYAGTPSYNPATGSFTGNVTTADRWTTPRTFALGGDAAGSVTLDGSSNVTLSVTIPGLAEAGVQSISLAGTTPRAGTVTITEADTVNTLLGGAVVRSFQGFSTRTGAITLTSADVTWALGYTPVQTFNSRSGNIVLNATDVTSALGATAVQNAVSAQSAVTALNYNGNIAGSQVQGNIAGNAASISGNIFGTQVQGNISGNAGGLSNTLQVTSGGTGANNAASARTNLGAAASGAVTASGITMTSARLLGRSTASAGAVEELSVGAGLSLSSGVLSATGSGGGVTSVGLSTGTTGLTVSGTTSQTITGTGTFAIAGTLAVGNGGTNATTAAGARSNLGAASLDANTFSGYQTAPGFIITGTSASFLLSGGATVLTFSGVSGNSFIDYNPSTTNFRAVIGSLVSLTVTTSGCTAPAFTPTSDRSLKKDITPVSGASDRVRAYQPVTFKWQDHAGFDTRTHAGFVAQDVEVVNPIAVSYADDVACLDPMPIIADLVSTVQELMGRIEALEAR